MNEVKLKNLRPRKVSSCNNYVTKWVLFTVLKIYVYQMGIIYAHKVQRLLCHGQNQHST